MFKKWVVIGTFVVLALAAVACADETPAAPTPVVPAQMTLPTAPTAKTNSSVVPPAKVEQPTVSKSPMAQPVPTPTPPIFIFTLNAAQLLGVDPATPSPKNVKSPHVHPAPVPGLMGSTQQWTVEYVNSWDGDTNNVEVIPAPLLMGSTLAFAAPPDSTLVAVVFVGSVAVAYAVQYWLHAQGIVMPQALPGTRPLPPHVVAHPRGDLTSLIKAAAWVLFWNAVASNKQPDWCGKRDKDGAMLLVIFDLAVQKTTGGFMKGVAVILNGNGTTAMAGFKGDEAGNPSQTRWDEFVKFPCPSGLATQ